MNGKIKRVKLYVKDTNNAHSAAKLVKELLEKYHFLVVDDMYDLAISIGGDGTFIKMLHANNFNNEIYYGSINAGSLGFLTSSDSANIEKYIIDLSNESFIIKDISFLNTKVLSNNQENNYLSLNEFTIRKSDFSTLKLDIFVNNQLLEKFTGDGLVISTSVGSTGYNQALGGSVIDNELRMILLTPIAPINNKVYKTLPNSLVLSEKSIITIIPNNKHNLCYLSDGVINNIPFDKITCQLNNTVVKCILPSDYNYINNLRIKLIDDKE